MTRNQAKRKREGGKHRFQLPWNILETAEDRFLLSVGLSKRKQQARRKKKLKAQKGKL